MALPAATASREGNYETHRNEAVRWVERNMRNIRGRAAKFQRYSPYDLEDFTQQAYAAALAAVDVSMNQGIPFEACFWVLFTADSRQMASNPATRNCYREFTEDYTEEGYAPTIVRESRQSAPDEIGDVADDVLTDELIAKALSVMTARQRDVWGYLLDRRHYSTAEIAGALKVRRQVIEELRDTGLRRVSRHFGGRP